MSRALTCRCGQPKDRGWHLVCATCWKRVPPVLQNEVYESYKEKQGSPRHTAAIRQVFTALGPVKKGRSEQVATIAAKFYEARDVLRTMFPDQYHTKVREWCDGLREVMRATRCDELTAAQALIKSAAEREERVACTAWILAATVELLEPSPAGGGA